MSDRPDDMPAVTIAYIYADSYTDADGNPRTDTYCYSVPDTFADALPDPGANTYANSASPDPHADPAARLPGVPE